MFCIKFQNSAVLSSYFSSLFSCVCMLSHFSHVWLFATLWIVACQATCPAHGILQAIILECIACPPPAMFLTQGSNPLWICLNLLWLSHVWERYPGCESIRFTTLLELCHIYLSFQVNNFILYFYTEVVYLRI